jgi:hypothetical protein
MKSFVLTLVALAVAAAAPANLGKPLALKETIGIDKLVAQAGKYAGKVVQVKGQVKDVCRHMGCWMELADPDTGKTIRIKVKDGEIVFPKDSVGKTAIAEGVLTKIELTREEAVAQAKHEAEANKREFDEASVPAGVAYYQIQATGAAILDSRALESS